MRRRRVSGNDFRRLSVLHGAPPKVISLHVANAPMRSIEALILARRQT
jgi:predicted nuclease of predicted toxin-antitoxin system